MQARLLLALLVLFTALAFAPGASAQQIRIIRDAEIESMVAGFAAPLYRAAGIERAPKITIVNDRRFNAFVTEDGGIYINHGTLLEVPSPNALKAILAHEIGHLAGGHIARLREQAQVRAQVQAISMVLGMGAIAATAGTAGSGEISGMATSLILASQSAGLNSLMAYRQSEESAADAAALRILRQAGESPEGLVTTMRILLDNQVQRAAAQGYLSTHPLAQDRLAQIETEARRSPYWGRGDSAADVRALNMAKAKLAGFLEPAATVMNMYPNGDSSLPARYARTIAAYRGGGGVSAVQVMPSLIAEQPSNPFLHELYGQMLYELGRPAEAIAPLRRALELAPQETQIRILYAQAMIGAGGEANLNEAVLQLKRSAVEERGNPRVHVLLGQAYNGLGRMGEATLAAAEAAVARREMPTARGLAQQAQAQLIQGSPEWLRAGDIVAMN